MTWIARCASPISIAFVLTAVASGSLAAQYSSAGPAVPTDTARPPYTARDVPVLPGAILPDSRIVAFYGNPMSTQMGILGALPPAQMLDKLAATAKEWARADTTRTVRPALQLIVTVAQHYRGADGKYRLRHSDSLIARVAGWAEQRGWLLFLDVQVGQSTVPAELTRLIPWLSKPWVHLALDPEFAMPSGRVPGIKLGTLDARDVNYAVDLLARLVSENHLPPKVLVVHRWTEDMLTHYRQIKRDPRVQVVIDMDGHGSPATKMHIYGLVVTRQPVQFTGFKLFYHHDRPMTSLLDILALHPVPLYIQYQ